jgi:hypothetical protein
VGRRIERQSDHVAQLGGKSRSRDNLKRRTRYGCRRCAAQIRCTERSDLPLAIAIDCLPVSPRWMDTQRQRDDAVDQPWRHRRQARLSLVFSRSRPLRMNRSCQRHTQDFRDPGAPRDLRRAAALRCRQSFCGLLRSATTTTNCSRSVALSSMLIPSRVAHDRKRSANMEPFDCVRPLEMAVP